MSVPVNGARTQLTFPTLLIVLIEKLPANTQKWMADSFRNRALERPTTWRFHCSADSRSRPCVGGRRSSLPAAILAAAFAVVPSLAPPPKYLTTTMANRLYLSKGRAQDI